MLAMVSESNETLGYGQRAFDRGRSFFEKKGEALLQSSGRLRVTIRNLRHTLPRDVARIAV